MKLDFDTKDLTIAVKMLERVGGSVQKTAAKAAGKARTVVRRSVRNEVPVETGMLKRGIISKGEKSGRKGKKVYDLMFDPGMNDVFQKPIKNPGEAGGKSPKGYYPASMEFGFLTRSKGGGLSYVPGYHFMRKGTEQSAAAAEKAMVQTVCDEIEKEWTK